MILTGTGTRRVVRDEVLCHKILDKTTSILANLEPELVITGMAEGFDEILARAAMRLGIPFKAYIPNKGYLGYYWEQNSQTGRNRMEIAQKILARAQEVQYICTSVYVGGMHSNFHRNIAMVNDADTVLALVSRIPSPGTTHCVNYALRSNKNVEMIYED